MSICLVTHCYAEKLPQYATLLKLQLASLVINPPDTDVVVAICYTPTDTLTNQIIKAFENQLKIKRYPLEKPNLFRRCIGRNLVALESTEDVVWFTDCDHCFLGNCIDAAVLTMEAAAESVSMIFPRRINISATHETGDQQVIEAAGFPLPSLYTAEFIQKRYRKPIGGVQIVRGSLAREYGYLNNTKWQGLATDVPFACFRDDGAYVVFCKSQGEVLGVDLPGVHRVRHGEKTHQY